MDQYPDENEEFELRYQDELEMLEEDEEVQYNVLPATQNNKGNAEASPSQLSHISEISIGATQFSNSVNRRLFSTPKAEQYQRGTSTPMTTKQILTPINEIVNLEPIDEEPMTSANAAAIAVALQSDGLRSKRRLERDLFGNIDDLYDHEPYEDPLTKKARTEEQRDLKDIEKILATRRQLREVNQAVRKDHLSRMKALEDFKAQNLSYKIPKWPFLPIMRCDGKRIYIRFHSEEYEQRELDKLRIKSNYASLLGDSKQQTWADANEIILRRTEIDKTNVGVAAPVPAQLNEKMGRLWVDIYKPRKYIDLLSDEMTNRSLLYWLKMWDKIVFGKEFKIKDEHTGNSDLNSFNKRTGKFESTGGWRARKPRQALNTNVDDLGRPIQKVALLCGPPGLGKTTLAHTIARHAGYVVREVNASDDRSPEAFKLALENGTQMSAVLNEDKRPNCIILDEIDGAPKQSVEFLVKFVSDNVVSKAKTKSAKAQHNILKRPIICICNDVYDPALRPLRQIAFVVTFPPIESARLAERLLQIARRERLKTDFGTLIALSEKSGNDVRCCISTMQFFSAQKKAVTLRDVLSNNLGQKDRHQGLFDIWSAIFRIQRPKRQLQTDNKGENQPEITMTDMSVSARVRAVMDVVHAGGDYERLMQGVYENFLTQKMPDPNFNGIVDALEWFCFTDRMFEQINRSQNYAVYPYLQFGFVKWHLLFASLAWPKINFPTRGFEYKQKATVQKNIFQALRKSISSNALGIGQGTVLLLDTVPILKHILSPQLRSVAVQLLSAKEKYDLKHIVEVMVDLGLTYIQIKSAEGPYVFQMEPDLNLLMQFPGYQGINLSYFGRQLITREVELERIRRSTPKTSTKPNPKKARIPNHLQVLKAKPVNETNKKQNNEEVMVKDFFGRIQRVAVSKLQEGASDSIVKSPIWFRYKEGFNNAVRRDVHMHELL